MNRYLLIVTALLLAACGKDEESPVAATPEVQATSTAAVESDPVKGINWFDGDVDEAFAAAKESGKPIYLYWGAVWCPPCHAIAATVFKSPEFIERSKLFIPVYLDGDTENAQAYGERFGVLGYPTMIVFDADGRELTRIPGGIDLQAYANILDLTLSDTAGAEQLVAGLAESGATLSDADCRLLAFYSWGQDTQILVETDGAVAFRQMLDACPADLALERSILFVNWLDARLADIETDTEAAPMSTEEQAEAIAMLGTILDDHEFTKANVFAVLFEGPRYTRALTEPGSDVEADLIEAFHLAFYRIRTDEAVYKRERIYSLVGRIRFERLHSEEAELSDDLKRQIRRTVAWADESTPSVYERQPIINALGNVLDEAGMDEEARPLLLAELTRSKQPYYFMVSLADIEQRAGNFDKAIEWLEKAHNVADGPATRFQWGYYYLAGLLEMAPDDTERIHDVTIGLIDELQNSMGLYQRPKAHLSRLEQDLIAWSEDTERRSNLTRIRDSVLKICAAAVNQGETRETCESFLDSV